jgi:hypothetical protein
MWQKSGAISGVLFHKEPKKIEVWFLHFETWAAYPAAKYFPFKSSQHRSNND